MKPQIRSRFDSNILMQFGKAMQIMGKMPSRLPFFIKSHSNQKAAAKIREKLSQQGLEVPPILIISITRRCNLNCSGCYSKLLHKDSSNELSPERLSEILSEARDLGISIVLLAGGEPLVRREILEVAAKFTMMIFPVFTNGLLLNSEYSRFFARNPHLIPVISLEGGKAETDFRRGEGVYQNFSSVIKDLNAKHIFWGISVTLTAQNYDQVLSENYGKALLALGCKLFFFVEYVPVAAGSEDLLLSEAQKAEVQPRVDRLMEKLPGMFIAFPGDEDQYEGCLAAGRGFLHINPAGKVEPCPFAPFSDTDLRYGTLKEALQSRFLTEIRNNHQLLKEGKGGCALWANKEWVKELADNING
jgi:MoaA/NifB/PqqE/SkfB family radical SAM enzyme